MTATTDAAQRALEGSDLDYVLFAISCIDPIDIETEDASDQDWAIHRALNYVRDEITIRLAVQAGSDKVGDYCGVNNDDYRACGSRLGLPDCRYHRVCATCGHNAATGGVDHYRAHASGLCTWPPSPQAA
ncbi:hypothetical protein K1W54_29795 [Micromonospora sp. CPCC 205371]|nr:hypothetical protein [Micromonospora sp. CPCC 205371]